MNRRGRKLHKLAAAHELEVIDCAAALESLRPEWSDLWERCPAATPFQTPEWLLRWWAHFGTGELCCLALRRHDRLVALVPLFVQTRRGKERCVLLLGTGVSDYLDALVEPGCETEAGELLFAYLADTATAWDTCDLQQLRGASPLLNGNWPGEGAVDAHEPCPVLELTGKVDRFAGVWPAQHEANLRYYRKRTEQIGGLRLERTGARDFVDRFRTFFDWQQARWQQTGVVADPVVQEFHWETAREMLEAGLLRLYALFFGERLAALYYGFLAKQRAWFYLAAFASELGQFSPGTLLLAEVIQQSMREGATEFDFLRGQERYKYRWGARDRLTYRRVLHSRARGGAC